MSSSDLLVVPPIGYLQEWGSGQKSRVRGSEVRGYFITTGPRRNFSYPNHGFLALDPSPFF